MKNDIGKEMRTNCDKVLRALQLIQLEALKEIDRICRKNNINYSLGGGTCLGRVRHGGFIPWDDDIDVDMTLENYDKFLNIVDKELNHDKFFLRSRLTDKNYLRTNLRLEIKNTSISISSWDSKKINSGIYIDIMSQTYLPNNKFLRKIVASLLFYIRCIYHYKMFHLYVRKGNQKMATIVVMLSYILPTKLLFFIEDKLRRCCKKKTNWLIDDSIVNGNHGGFPSKGIDTYKDVNFEGIKVMDKENPHEFLKILYGNNYMEWLNPINRVSHHLWTKLDFGNYAKNYDLPANYQTYLSIEYNDLKLKRMQELSIEMVGCIDKICQENKINYYVLGVNAYLKFKNYQDFEKYFHEPFKIGMSRSDYLKFSNIAQKEFKNKYFFQTEETDKEYKCKYAKMILKYTYIRDNSFPRFIEDKFTNGLFVEIVPLDNTSNDLKTRIKHIKKIQKLSDLKDLKWKHYNFRYFIKKNIKIKIKMLYLILIPLKTINQKLDKLIMKYDDVDTNYYIDIINYNCIKKSVFGKGNKLEYGNKKLNFPVSNKEYLEYLEKNKLVELENIKKLDKIKKDFAYCFLTYYDIKEYQLSSLRYDKKRNKYLTNEEIINNE